MNKENILRFRNVDEIFRKYIPSYQIASQEEKKYGNLKVRKIITTKLLPDFGKRLTLHRKP